MTTTRFPNGVTNVGEDSVFAQMGQLSPTQYHSYWEDFDYFVPSDWTVVTSGSTATLLDADNGVFAIDDPTGVEASDAEVTKNYRSFTFEPGKKMWFETRVKSLDPTANKTQVRLNYQGMSQEGLGFYTAVTSPTIIDFVILSNNNPSAIVSIGQMPADQYVTLGWHYDGDQTIFIFRDGQHVASVSLVTSAPPSSAEPLQPQIRQAVLTPGAPGQTAVDYLYIVKER